MLGAVRTPCLITSRLASEQIGITIDRPQWPITTPVAARRGKRAHHDIAANYSKWTYFGW